MLEKWKDAEVVGLMIQVQRIMPLSQLMKMEIVRRIFAYVQDEKGQRSEAFCFNRFNKCTSESHFWIWFPGEVTCGDKQTILEFHAVLYKLPPSVVIILLNSYFMQMKWTYIGKDTVLNFHFLWRKMHYQVQMKKGLFNSVISWWC